MTSPGFSQEQYTKEQGLPGDFIDQIWPLWLYLAIDANLCCMFVDSWPVNGWGQLQSLAGKDK